MSALRGDTQIAPSEIFASVGSQACDLGARFTTGDGRVFRYALGSGTALVAGKVYQASPQDTSNWQKLGVSVVAGTNTTSVTIGSSITLAQNILAGGTLTVRNSTGQGYTYGIKGHAAVTSGTVVINLSDQIQVAIGTATSQVDLTPNPYSNVVVAPATLTGIPIGVAVNATTASNYGFIQTRGICDVLSDGVVTVGQPAACSVAVSGALASAGGTQTVFATAAITTVDTKYCPFFLQFE